MVYGTYNVDEKYSPIVEANLYYDSIFQPGLTFSDAHQGDATAGMVKIYKAGEDGIADPKLPATDFNNTQASNDLIALAINNVQAKSKKIYRAQETAVPYEAGVMHMEQAMAEAKAGWQASGLACLAHEGKLIEDTATLSKSNIKEKMVAGRKAVRTGRGVANVIMASVETYSTMLLAAGDQFTPYVNEEIFRTGNVGMWMGMLWIECNMLDNLDAAKYYDFASELQSEDLTKVDYIMYDWNRFHIVDLLSMSRIINSENFNGSLAQLEMVSGYRVSNPASVIIKKHA